MFKEIIKETNELYEDLRSEYETIDTVTEEFNEFLKSLIPKLGEEEAKVLEDFAVKLNKLNNCNKISVRDIREILRNQKKMLNEISRELN